MGFCRDYGKAGVYIKVISIGILVKLILNVTLISIEGIYEKGAIISTIISDLLICCLLFKVMNKKMRIEIKLWNKILKVVFSISVSMGLIINFKMHFILKIFLILLIYMILIFITKVFSKEEVKMLPNGGKLYVFMKKIKIY